MLLLTAILAFAPHLTRAQSNPPQNSSTTTITCAVNLQISTDGKPLLDDATKSYRAHQLEAAADAYNRLIAKSTDLAYAYAGIERVYLRMDKISEAYAAAQSAAAAAPGTIPAQVALGEMYFRQGEFIDAERAFLSTCGNDAQASMGLVRIYEISGFYLHAAAAFAVARRLAPDDPDLRWSRLYGDAIEARQIPLNQPAADQPADGSAAKDSSTAPQPPIVSAVLDEHACRVVSKSSNVQVGIEPVVNPGPTGSSKFPADHAAAYLLPVRLDGTQAKLEVDTGAYGILISNKLAERAGIKPVAQNKFSGIGDKGPVDSYIGVVNSLKIGDLEMQGCFVTVSDRKLQLAGMDGLIGPVIFEDFLVDLDFPDAKLKLSPLPAIPASLLSNSPVPSGAKGDAPLHDRYVAPEMKSYTPVFRFGYDLLVGTSVNSSPVKLFLLDTGSFDSVVTPETARASSHISSQDGMIVKGLSGTVEKVGTADRLMIQFGHLKDFRNELVTLDLSRISNSIGTEVSGILGFAMLRAIDVKIDYRDALVDFNYDPHRMH
jgi:tetratricopeptide (TPR) repeat protein